MFFAGLCVHSSMAYPTAGEKPDPELAAVLQEYLSKTNGDPETALEFSIPDSFARRDDPNQPGPGDPNQHGGHSSHYGRINEILDDVDEMVSDSEIQEFDTNLQEAETEGFNLKGNLPTV